MKKISAVRVLELSGAEEAIRLYPDYKVFILSIKDSDFKLVQKSLIQDLQRFKSAS